MEIHFWDASETSGLVSSGDHVAAGTQYSNTDFDAGNGRKFEANLKANCHIYADLQNYSTYFLAIVCS